MPLRTDKVSGAITGIFGVAQAGFAAFGLFIVGMQRLFLSVMEGRRNDVHFDEFAASMRTLHGIWFIYMPITFAAGVVFAAAGFYVYRGSTLARRIAQLTALGGYVWLAMYMTSCYRVMDIVGPPPEMFPEPARQIFQVTTFILSAIVCGAFPTGLLYVLSRPTDRRR